jgi:hypothetical protein
MGSVQSGKCNEELHTFYIPWACIGGGRQCSIVKEVVLPQRSGSQSQGMIKYKGHATVC